jgi:predicted RNA methylase
MRESDPSLERNERLKEFVVLSLIAGAVWIVLRIYKPEYADPTPVAVFTASIIALWFLLSRFTNVRLRDWQRLLFVVRPERLSSRLHQKYRQTTFHIASRPSVFYRRVARVLLSAIAHSRQLNPVDSMGRPQLTYVGVVCGPMVFNTATYLAKLRGPKHVGGVRFVAMNKAAESEDFKYSANFLVTALADCFNDSKPIAYTFNDYDRERLNAARRSVDILLCSAGAIRDSRQSYLNIWFDKRKRFSQTTHTLPPECIGDFCLQPIDADGRLVGTPGLLDDLREQLDPYPQFETLSEKSQQRSHVIFPVGVAFEADGRDGQRGGKQAITRTVLASGVVDDCILDRWLARDLVRALGDYLLESISKHEEDKPVRSCYARRLGRDGGKRPFHIYDPVGRADAVCKVDDELRSSERKIETIPDVVISESYSDLAGFDFAQAEGLYRCKLDGNQYDFDVHRGVRKPGQFSMATLQVVHRQASALVTDRRRGLSIWDVGCGCGFVGLLAAKTLGASVESLYASDVSDAALDCTNSNLRKLGLNRTIAKVFSSNVLDSPPDVDRLHDIIAFNPPFLPNGLSRHPAVDSGGVTGTELAVRFAASVHQRLKAGGVAIVAIADYVDRGEVRAELVKTFGRVSVDEQLLLFPYEPPRHIELAYEVEMREQIEDICGYRFETLLLGHRKFLSFKIRSYVAQLT